jgi:hypothetical protein
MPAAHRVLASALTALGFAALVALAPAFALTIAPVALLVVLLVNGWAPGEELIERLRRRAAAPQRRWARALPQRQYVLLLPRRTGRLIASALAMRPPPVAVAVSS